MGNVIGGPESVVKALQKLVGQNGTIVMPAYAGLSNFKNLMESGSLINLRREKSQQGSISEAFRQSEGVNRSSHPFSSCCAWGKNAEYITSGHEEDERICHRSSPLSKAMELNAKVIGIGVDMGPISFYHVIEDTWDEYPIKVYSESVQAKYIDQFGNIVERKVKFYKPELTKVRIDSDNNLWIRRKITAKFDSLNLRKKFDIGTGHGWHISSKDFYDVIKRLAQDNQITIYTMSAGGQKEVNS